MAEEELGPSLQQMDPATRRENLIAFLIDMNIVAKAADEPALVARLARGAHLIAPGA